MIGHQLVSLPKTTWVWTLQSMLRMPFHWRNFVVAWEAANQRMQSRTKADAAASTDPGPQITAHGGVHIC